MRPMSLAWRIRLLVTLVVTVIVSAVCGTAYLRFRVAYLGHIDRMLEVMSNGAVAAVDGPDAGPALADDLRRITESPWRGPGTHFRLWLDGRDDDLASSAPAGGKKTAFLRDLGGVAPPGTEEPVFFDLTDKRKHYRAVWVRHETGRGTANVLIAHPSSFEHRRLDDLLWTLLVAGGAMILLGATVGAWLVLVGLRPLGAAASRLAGITSTSLAAPDLEGLAVPRELRGIVDEVGRLLERLRAALEHQKRFVADASHQLRTPLSIAQSSLELARSRDRTPAEYRQAIDETLDDVGRMQWLIDELLVLARIDRAAAPDEAVDVCLDALLRELAITHDRKAAAHGGAVGCGDLAPCVVRGSDRLLGLLFGNLLDNAVQYGPEGGTVRVGLDLGPGGSCTATVQDEGGGIAPEALPHLFDRFYRAESARPRHPRGAGLGLAIAREIALQHGGDLWVTSNPGARTTFHVRLPCSCRPGDPSDAPGGPGG